MSNMIRFTSLLVLTSLLGISYSDDSRIYFENELPQINSIPSKIAMQSISAPINSIPSKIGMESISAPTKTIPLLKTKKETSLATGVSKFAFDLDRTISTMSLSDNILFSPLCISSVMAVLLLGARGNTSLELSQLLGSQIKAGRRSLNYRFDPLHEQFGNLISKINNKSNKEFEVDSATAIFPQSNHPVKPEYITAVQKLYQSDVMPLDYFHHNKEALEIINRWVSNKTNDRIKSILSEPPPPDTTVIVTSALYFNGNWEYPFIEKLTKQQPFYTESNLGNNKEEEIEVKMMANAAKIPYLNDKVRKCEMIGIPYKGHDMHMYIILPDENIETFMKTFNENDLHSMINSTEKTMVIYAIPKMTLESSVDLTNPLQKLGVRSLFEPTKADLKNIANSNMFVNKIVHKVELDINEYGTKAAAVTLALISKSGTTPLVRVERPFLFFIYHNKTDSILFWGKVTRPTPNYPRKNRKAL